MDEPPSRGQQQADAVGLIAEAALRHELDPGPPGARYQVVVHVEAAVLAEPREPAPPPFRGEDVSAETCPGSGPESPTGPTGPPGQAVLEGGTRVSAETSRRLACDASRVTMGQGPEGQVLAVGRRTRTISPALRRALLARDQGCRFPGCGLSHGQGHHLRHWAHGGPTSLENLALLCRRHHRAVHEEGYQVERGADGALRFRRPDGRPLPEVPRPAAVPADPVGALQHGHQARGLRIHARTACATGTGEPFDPGWILDVLHPLARGAEIAGAPGGARRG